MPHVYMKATNLEGVPLAGDGDCVALVKKYAPGLQGQPTSASNVSEAYYVIE